MIGLGEMFLTLFGGVGGAFLMLLLSMAILLLTEELVYLAIRAWEKEWWRGLRVTNLLGGLGDGVI